MTLLILGGSGMFGHRLWLTARARCRAVAASRTDVGVVGGMVPASSEWLAGVDALRIDTVARALDAVGPDAVVNAIGLVKHRPEAHDARALHAVNAEFPHLLAALCRAAGARLVHLSTDCVFSGARGKYTEDDVPDPVDPYGRSKLAGEVTGPGVLTLRTSMVGRELASAQGLVEWFLAGRHREVAGYRRAIFSGLTTHALAGVVMDVVERHPALEGIYHLSADSISKCELLELVARAFCVQTRVVPVDEPRLDRSLDSSRFRAATGFVPCPWPEMVGEMARDARAAGEGTS